MKSKTVKSTKGFTLIELLAVIIIIGILLGIAVPGISRYLRKGTTEYYHQLEDSLLLAGRDYLDDYRTLYPTEVGNVTVVDLDELVMNQKVDEVVDSNGNTCSGKIIAKKVKQDQYEYYSCLICDGYQTVSENCNYTEDDNITPETKNYKIVVEPDQYTVEQGKDFEVPKAKVYYFDELVTDSLVGNPRMIDTNQLGTTTVTYSYKGQKKSITVTVVDKVKPSIPQVVLRYDNSKGRSYKGEWYRNNIYVEYKSTDYTKKNLEGSGIAYYEVSSDNKTWKKINGNYQIHSDNGNLTYYVRSVDQAGNVSDSNSYNVKIDKATPSCEIVVTGTKTTPQNAWYVGNVTMKLSVTPTASGVLKQTLSKESITENTEGTQVTGSVTSVAGVVGTCDVTIKLDKNTPSAPVIAANDNIKSGSWHKADTTLSLSGSSSLSKITYYLDTNSNPTTARSSLKITDNTGSTRYYAKACNGAGTCSSVSNYELKLDKSKPQCSVVVATGTAGSGGWYTSDITLKLQITETISGISSQTISLNKITENTKGQPVTGSVTSNAGIVGTCSATFKLDKTTPAKPTLAATDGIASGKWHKADTTLTASGSSSTSGITYYLDTNSNPTTAGSSLKITNNTESTTYYAKACNGAGTCSGVVSYELKLDKSTPSTPSLAATDGKASGTWHTGTTTLNASGSSALSGVTYYIDTNSNPTTVRNSVQITENTASTKYYVKACSGSGICSSVSSYEVKLDKSTPSKPSLAANDGIGSGKWHKTDTTLTASESSSTSGITYYLDTNSNPTTARSSLKITDNTGSTTYYAKACNGAGTCSSVVSYELKLDKLPPTTPSLVATDGKASGNWHTGPTTLNASGGSALSGVTYYIDASSNPTTARNSIQIAENTASTKYYVKACSGSGICSSVSSYELKLDQTAPTVTAKATDNNITTTTNADIQSYFTITASGPSGGSTICKVGTNTVSNTNNLSQGLNTVVCTTTSGSGLTASASTIFHHKYTATGSCTNGGQLQNNNACYYADNGGICGTTCHYGCDSVYNSCKTGSPNACKGGYTSTCYNTCSDSDTFNTPNYPDYVSSACSRSCSGKSNCSCSCPSGPNGAALNCTYSYSYSCNPYPCGWSNCATTENTCQGGYEDKNCSNCKTQSNNSCTKTDSTYLKYSCPTKGTNGNTGASIDATVSGSECIF